MTTDETLKTALTTVEGGGFKDSEEGFTRVCDLFFQGTEECLRHASVPEGKIKNCRGSVGKIMEALGASAPEPLLEIMKRFRSKMLTLRKAKVFSLEELRVLISLTGAFFDQAGLEESPYKPLIPFKTNVVNSLAVETVNGFRTFQIIHGNIVRIPADLLIVSTHGNPKEAPSGQQVEALQRMGIAVDPEAIFQYIERERIWTCFQGALPTGPIRNLLTIRMVKSREMENPAAFFETAVKGLFGSIAALEFTGNAFSEISMPLIYGQRIVDFNAALRTLIRNAVNWLKISRHTQTINFVVYHADELADWDAAMNEILGRSTVSAGNSLVLDGMTREILDLLMPLQDGMLGGATGPLVHSFSRLDNICIENVCTNGRKLTELIVDDLIQRWELKKSSDLCKNIEVLAASKLVAPWMCSYMHSLRIFGNAVVHEHAQSPYAPEKLNSQDLIAALSAVKSLVLFWKSLPPRG
ncbi:MAG: hypothetical protein WA705_03195 [Candidatus Ozemobacteraceae bacterium]